MNRFRKLGFIRYNAASLKSTVHFSTSFFTTQRIWAFGVYCLADRTTLGFAISLTTSASVALADCFFVFFFIHARMISRVRAFKVNLDQPSHSEL